MSHGILAPARQSLATEPIGQRPLFGPNWQAILLALPLFAGCRNKKKSTEALYCNKICFSFVICIA